MHTTLKMSDTVPTLNLPATLKGSLLLHLFDGMGRDHQQSSMKTNQCTVHSLH